jgi:hypothetical protein
MPDEFQGIVYGFLVKLCLKYFELKLVSEAERNVYKLAPEFRSETTFEKTRLTVTDMHRKNGNLCFPTFDRSSKKIRIRKKTRTNGFLSEVSNLIKREKIPSPRIAVRYRSSHPPRGLIYVSQNHLNWLI